MAGTPRLHSAIAGRANGAAGLGDHALDRDSVILGQGAHVQCVGKGRKERSTPLTKVAQQALRYWLKGAHNARRNGSLPEYARWQAQRRRRAGTAEQICRQSARALRLPSLKAGVASCLAALRHAAAMELLQVGVDCSVIALWLSHEAMETTLTYLHAHLELKETALAKLKPYELVKAERFRPSDRLLEFLNAL
ncbi:tyrosine-type recombinase/integrase [Sinorhizobium meliloti]|uniref:tyrosine-type recombinase/integrase n=1 Tax=Rhizobium meliloti TaxID=382 RepID=UPI002D77DEA7|nr:tyrosine-type recombinase/integrase [Sinorhizobium meliloti]